MDWQQTMADVVDKVQGWLEAAILHLPDLAMAVVVFILFWLTAKLVGKGLRRLLAKTSAPRQIRGLVVNVARVAVLVTGLFIALGVLNLDKTVTSLLAGAGIIGLALGFAFQDMASNFMSGVYMAFARPIQVGDLVETNDHFGTVEQVNLRSLRLRTPEGQYVLIPNSLVFQTPVVNFSSLGARRIDLSVGVAYGDDLKQAAEIAKQAVAGVPGRDEDRDVELFYTEFGGSSINFVVRFWIPFERQPDFLEARSQAIQRVKLAFDEAGVTIPFPITTLDFGVVGGQPLAEALPPGLLGDGGSDDGGSGEGGAGSDSRPAGDAGSAEG